MNLGPSEKRQWAANQRKPFDFAQGHEAREMVFAVLKSKTYKNRTYIFTGA
jgi:hypothetical protein